MMDGRHFFLELARRRLAAGVRLGDPHCIEIAAKGVDAYLAEVSPAGQERTFKPLAVSPN